MCSTRKLSAFVVTFSLAVVGALAGCQRIVPPPVSSPVNNPDPLLDEPTQIRDFDQSTAYYPSGATVAGGTGYLWQTHETIPPGFRRYADVPVAAANIASMPV